jgi:ribonuclease R
MSGLVPLSQMHDDFYVFDPARNHLVGRRTRRIIRLGDTLQVQVAKVDTFKKQVDFRVVEERKPGRDGGGRIEPARDFRSDRGTRPQRRESGNALPRSGERMRRIPVANGTAGSSRQQKRSGRPPTQWKRRGRR